MARTRMVAKEVKPKGKLPKGFFKVGVIPKALWPYPEMRELRYDGEEG